MIRRHVIAIWIRYAGDGSPALVSSEVYFLIGTWRTLLPRSILHVPGAIRVHGDFLPGELQTQAHRSGAENSTDWAFAPPWYCIEQVNKQLFENQKLDEVK